MLFPNVFRRFDAIREKKIQFSVIFDVIEFAPLFGTTSWQSIIELRKIFHAFEISRSAHKLICKIEKFMLIESAPKCDCGRFSFFHGLCQSGTCQLPRVSHPSWVCINYRRWCFAFYDEQHSNGWGVRRSHERTDVESETISSRFFLSLLCLNYLGKHNSRFRQFITWRWGWRKIESLTYSAAVWDSELQKRQTRRVSWFINRKVFIYFSRRHKT